MGLMWSFLNPAIMLMIYTFVFSVVFKARWNVDTQSKTEFALILFSGLIIFNLFSECASRAPSLILSNANYVKRVVFPLEILPIVSLAASLVHAFISFVVWLIAYCIFMGVPHIMILLIPFVVLPLLLLILGVTWGLASLGVFLRDVSQFIGMVVTAFLFMSPIFYPITALPEKYRVILRLNPLSPALEQTRDVLFWNKMPDIRIWILYLMLSAIVSWLGFYFFQKTRKGFADVL
jgi:lipopolysaccharide transport system permease protein